MNAWRTLWRREPVLATVALLHALLALVLAGLAFNDPMTVMGAPRWMKPIKFALSIAVYLATLAWYAPVIGVGRARRWPLWIIAATMVVEMGLITWQAARGVRSHFNIGALFDGVVFAIMGVVILLNTLLLAWCGWRASTAWRAGLGAGDDGGTRAGDGYRLGMVLGIAIAVAGSAVGGLMVRLLAHSVGVPDGGPGLPLLNWSTTGGDLRVAHFVGLHALQGVPWLGWRFGIRGAWIGAMLWFAVTAAALAQAWSGQPVWRE